MAEISYPFSADDAITGAAKAVSETQWQSMAHMWGADRVDFRLPISNTGVSIPFSPKVLSSTSVQINPGKAWVGGFYYELTSTLTVPIEANTSTTGRIDLIVVRADMAKPSVQIAVRKGTNSATPISPKPVRETGGIWEMPLYAVTVPAQNGPLDMARRAPFDIPPAVSFPWDVVQSTELAPLNSFTYDSDVDGAHTQTEYFNGRDGVQVARTLSNTYTYSPSVVGGAVGGGPVTSRNGRWRWIAPNMVWFSMRLENTSSTADMKVFGSFAFGVTLPTPASGATGQIFSGHMDNNTKAAGGLPNFVDLVGKVNKGGATSNMYIYYPNPNTLSQGLDGLGVIPRNSFITFSGVYETDAIKDR
ncbi:hypothetical protein ABT115_08755 [Streptomyces sp. NPDC001832]|uniref:hypothetical protein n=1 Tax=Streptomyces sp. NPDC001832 TaxID=3154527 RepID=UPI003333C598